MFRLDDTGIVLSASDIANHLACPHLTQQRLAIARRERCKPRPVDDPHAELVRERGDEHEERELAKLVAAANGAHADLRAVKVAYTRAELETAAAETRAAMAEGAAIISQGLLFDGRWQGRVDVLRRVPIRSALGSYSYEVLDMKLARQVKPPVVHQLSLYTRLLGEVQGVTHRAAYVIRGDGSIEPIHLGRYAALHRHVVRGLEEIVAAPGIATYPEPVAFCDLCSLSVECHEQRVRDDHLSLVAGARRDQREKLVEAGLPTMTALGHAAKMHDHARLADEQFELLRHQARLQVRSRKVREPLHRHLEPQAGRGYARLPKPSPGDVFFDFEGDPFAGNDGGIEYLWGWWTEDRGYECLWAHDAEQEQAALEAFVGFLVERRAQYPDLRVFHYAPHEASKLKSLALKYATCEEEVDVLLRAGVLVDLYAVVRQGLQVGEESYSLKRLERHHGFVRLEKSVREGGGSIIAYETWMKTREADLLEAIRAYNDEDCRSMLSLRNWLWNEMLPEARARFGEDAFAFGEPEEPHDPPAWLPEVQALIRRLEDGLPKELAEDSVDQTERRLAAQLLLYHYRESKPDYWRYFELQKMSPVELLAERDALAALRPDPSRSPLAWKQSLDHAFTFPEQEFKLGLGGVEDPTTGRKYKLVAIEDDHVRLRRGAKAGPLMDAPAALIDGPPPWTTVLREALVAIAEDVLAGGGRFAAARSVLRRSAPRLAAGALGGSVDELVGATLGLDRSHLAVQGPPGTGKTFRGARMIVEAVRAGRRVGVTAFSHAAIQNMLRDVKAYAASVGFEFAGVYKGDGYDSPHDLVEVVDSNGDTEGDFALVAGTPWLFARPVWREDPLSVLFVDEAGQLALASALAASTAAENLVLLGDPQQLPQVTQATHPVGSGASVLEHLLAGRATIAADRGVLLDESWRMHPDVCAFVSERSYDRLLHSRRECALRRVDSRGSLGGAGLRFVSVDHDGRSQASEEEAAAIASLCSELLVSETLVYDDTGTAAPLRPDQIMVVAPYNLAVQCISSRVPAGVRVGTVDKFQGQQAPIVFFAMTSSSGEDVPRGLDFLFSKNRLNVAVSRAQCLALVVASPRLLDADCRTLETMELVDGVCRFREMAEPDFTPELRPLGCLDPTI